MMEGERFIIRVPGSTANLGPGFDSIGLALNQYLTLEVEKASHWKVEMLSEELKVFPNDKTNFIIQVALETVKKYGCNLPPCLIKMKSEIPLTRGLGSSAAAIIAGIELADSLGHLNLSREEKLSLAASKEGHPDNVGASLYGGLIIGKQDGEKVDVVSFQPVPFDVVAVIPHEELETKDSRNALPKQLSFSEAVKAGAISNVLVAAFLTGDHKLAGKMMKEDLYHQPYRKLLVPHLQEVDEISLREGAFGVALSGAGPTVVCFAEKGKGQSLKNKLQLLMPQMDVRNLAIDQAGSKVMISERCQKYHSN